MESITFFSDEELLAAGVDPAMLNDPDYVKAGAHAGRHRAVRRGVLRLSRPREAEIIDPQQRLFLECAWEALEHAGYDAERYAGAIGVYAGAGMNTYLLFNLYANPELIGVGRRLSRS